MPALLSPSTVLARSERLSWRVLDGNRSVEGIALTLTNEYEISHEDAVEQLLELADGLVGNDLVEVRS